MMKALNSYNGGLDMAVQIKNLTKEQIDNICRAIGDSFYDHDYGDP